MEIKNQITGNDQGMHFDDNEKTYHLKCEVKRKTVSRISDDHKYELKMVYLIPRMSGDMVRFFNCYLPEYVLECDNNEIVFINYLNGNPFRGFLSPPTKEINERHIFIMTDHERDFLEANFTEGLLIDVEAVPHSEQINYPV